MPVQDDFYDTELERHNRHFRAAVRVAPGDRVLDIGCGFGQTTRQAARAAVDGHVVGLDASAPMLERARELSQAEGLHNIEFQEGDAQVHSLPPAGFDLAISRFGTMFFNDAEAAFVNIGRAVRPGGRFVQLVWQVRERNEWAGAWGRALTGESSAPPGPGKDPDPFSLGDPALTGALLTKAGFTDVDFADVDEPVFYGPDTATAYEAVLSLQEAFMRQLQGTTAERAQQRLRDLLTAHTTPEGVLFDSRAWIVSARKT